MAVAVVVDWWGPYTTAELKNGKAPAWRDSGAKALYMSLGPHNVCRYVGRTQRDVRKRVSGHHKLDEGNTLFVGRLSSPGKPGPKPKKVPPDLDMAEQTLVYVLQPQDNEQLKQKPPEECACVFSRLFDPHDHDKPAPEIPPKFPTFVAYDPTTSKAILVKGV